MKNKNSFIRNIVFWGAIWGIAEASLGYILHLLPSRISGSIMFPIGASILLLAYQRNCNKLTAIGVGAIAACIKMVNFLMPNTSTMGVLNPMISIMIESVLIAIAIPMVVHNKLYIRSLCIIGTSVLWKGTYAVFMVMDYFKTGYLREYLRTFEKAANFILVNGGISGLLTIPLISVICYKGKHKTREQYYVPSVLVSGTVMLFAVILTYFS